MENPYTLVTQRDVQRIERGKGVSTEIFASPELTHATYTSGITRLPGRRSVPRHFHNCDEQVTILSGKGEVEVLDARFPIGTLETAYIKAGAMHCFHNRGDDELVMFFIYNGMHVTRTFEHSGETVAHLSVGDKV